MKNLVYIVIGVGVVLAIAIGAAIYQQQTTQKVKAPAGSQAVVNQKATQQTPPQSLPSAEEENLVKSVSAVKNTPEARIAYRKKLDLYAKDVTTIEIVNCKPSPLVAKVKENSRPYITNKDNIAHALRLGATDLNVPANGDISVGIGEIDLYTNFSCVGGAEGLWIPAETP